MTIELGPLHHIGMVVPSLDAARNLFVTQLGAQRFGDDADVGIARIGFVRMPALLVELIEPVVAGTDLAAVLDAHPEGGQHHLCHAVDDIHAAWASCAAAGAQFLSAITPGVLGLPIFFVRLPALPGLLIELIEAG